MIVAHDFAETYGGAERIIAEVLDSFPGAPLWAILGRRSVGERMGAGDRFHTLLPERKRLLRSYRLLAPLFPALVRSRVLPECDVLISSSYAFAHGFRTSNRAPHVCYCYSPLRFAWSMTDQYALERARGPVRRLAFDAFAATMRAVDKRTSRNVDQYLTYSDFIADQIRRHYGREAEIVGAPVDCDLFRPDPAGGGHDDYFLFCGRLVEAYKRPSLAVEAFRRLPDRRLIVAGDGPELQSLRRIAPPNVEFVGHLQDRDLIPLMQRCTAAIFPSRDDFGLIPVEVMACGRPVLAYAAGGALTTMVPGLTGELFRSQTIEAVEDAVRAFDPDAYDPVAIRRHAERWDRRRFRGAVIDAVQAAAQRRATA